MKRILITALLTAVVVLSLPAATIALQYSPDPVSLGDTFTVTVNVTDVFADRSGDVLFGFGLTPTISDPSKVTFIGGTVNSLFIDTSSGGIISGSAIPPLAFSDFSEPLTLAILTFQTIGSGYVDVGVSSDLRDPNQGLVYFLTDTLDLTTSGTIDVVPEPAAAFLIVPSLAALLLAARRRRPV
jgi:hypothetical protein